MPLQLWHPGLQMAWELRCTSCRLFTHRWSTCRVKPWQRHPQGHVFELLLHDLVFWLYLNSSICFPVVCANVWPGRRWMPCPNTMSPAQRKTQWWMSGLCEQSVTLTDQCLSKLLYKIMQQLCLWLCKCSLILTPWPSMQEVEGTRDRRAEGS